MDINLTLLGQMITFAIFVWFSMKFVWPLLEKTLNERTQKIAEGLQAAERGHKELEISKKTATHELREARIQANEIVEHAHKQAASLIEEAKAEAARERARIVAAGKEEVELQRQTAKRELQGEVVNLIIHSTEKLLQRSLTENDKKALLDLKQGDLNV